ncbi:MAG: hypothetical protein M5R36_21225 [Deltaproteobacteria bacterium]|nr:hypothetical protein [Deltaproteobacteria bacterium]
MKPDASMMRLAACAALVALAVAGCGAGQGAIVVPIPADALDNRPAPELPLRLAWVRPLDEKPMDVPFQPAEFSTPAVADGRVYAGVSNGRFFCALRKERQPAVAFRRLRADREPSGDLWGYRHPRRFGRHGLRARRGVGFRAMDL